MRDYSSPSNMGGYELSETFPTVSENNSTVVHENLTEFSTFLPLDLGFIDPFIAIPAKNG